MKASQVCRYAMVCRHTILRKCRYNRILSREVQVDASLACPQAANTEREQRADRGRSFGMVNPWQENYSISFLYLSYRALFQISRKESFEKEAGQCKVKLKSQKPQQSMQRHRKATDETHPVRHSKFANQRFDKAPKPRHQFNAADAQYDSAIWSAAFSLSWILPLQITSNWGLLGSVVNQYSDMKR